ncbi:MAG: ankyrin repeat domain-containing protein [Acidobacteria bacterium]|nr:ankyrin repeat domain-containing protein [Acidobacteriota bacterium]
MHWQRIAGLALLMVGVAGASVAAENPTLADAAERRNTALVRTLLAARADVNTAQVDGMTALHWAVYHDEAEMAGLLVRSGANVNATNLYGVPPLSLAAMNGNGALVRLLLEAGADANASQPGGETVLMTAARAGSVDAVKALLARGANPNARERRDQTALMWAAAEGHAAVVQALIDGGADVRARLKSGFTPLFFAVREGHIEVTRTLLEAGANVKETLQPGDDRSAVEVIGKYDDPAQKGTSPLLMAVENGHFELAVALVDAGADPNDRRTGFTALHAVTWVRRPDASDAGDPPPIGSGRLTSLQFVRALVEGGANVNARLEKGAPKAPYAATLLEPEGSTPFLMAADRADVPLMRELLELGADPLLPNADNTTPLMAAAGLGTANPLEEAGTEAEALEAVQLLLERGADVNAVDSNGDTAMHGAAYGNFPAIVQLLTDRGADINIWKRQDTAGRTPLFIAEGYKAGRPQPSKPTIDVLRRLMVAAGVPTDGPRPRIIDIYERVPEPPKDPTKP